MIKNKYYTTLTDQQKDFFKLFSDEYLFNNQTQIIYGGQIPMAAYVLLEGQFLLKDAQKRIVRTCAPYSLLGFAEIYNNSPYKYTAEIIGGSKVLILGRSSIFEIQSSSNQAVNIQPFIEIA